MLHPHLQEAAEGAKEAHKKLREAEGVATLASSSSSVATSPEQRITSDQSYVTLMRTAIDALSMAWWGAMGGSRVKVDEAREF